MPLRLAVALPPAVLLATAVGVASAAAPGTAQGGGWPMEGRDVRRTGQSDAVGPRAPDAASRVALPFEQAVNVPPTVAADGTVYAGTWGMIRSYGHADRRLWHKSDGKLSTPVSDLRSGPTPALSLPVPAASGAPPFLSQSPAPRQVVAP